MVLSEDGIKVHSDIKDPDTGQDLKFLPENQALRDSIIRVVFDDTAEHLFTCQSIPVRPEPTDRKAFELAWADFREQKIFNQ